jgi:DNA-directed RNA polymerase I subunit RPA1
MPGADLIGPTQCDPSMFFLQTLLIPPNRFRPPVHLGDSQFEHPLNVHFKNIMQENEAILNLLQTQQGETEDEAMLDSAVLNKRWNAMQGHINVMIDSTKAERAPAAGVKGVRQDLERKEGLMRMNMMGKRVNFACRSVISPDPFMNTDQVGIPEVFAKKLSWPEPVNQYNARRLRAAVLNGPDVWPGANYIIDERGNKIDLTKKNANFRMSLAKQLEKKDAKGQNWKIGRHLHDGDFVLVNRQPTLHKVSLMAHKVRVNKGQRVIRFHYANCKSYNADFDGDEINVHFPQDQLGRAEAAVIVQNDHQYLVPTDGSPVRGLIQDHIVAAVQICQLDRLFTRREYTELVFLSLANLQATLRPGCLRLWPTTPAAVRPALPDAGSHR